MLTNSKWLYFLSFMLMFSVGCEDEEAADDHDDHTTVMETPTEYVFESQELCYLSHCLWYRLLDNNKSKKGG